MATTREHGMDADATVVLKRDSLGRVERCAAVTPDGLPFVRRVPTRWPLLGFAALLLLRRERRALLALQGLADVPHLLPAAGDGLRRSWIPGQPLALATRLPRDYFDRLRDLVLELHARGVSHNDLHKEGNILVQPSGRPALIDFQLASVHRGRGRPFRVRAAEDLRHIAKHRAVYLRATGRADAASTAPMPPPSRTARLWRRWWKPFYNLVTRRLGLRRLRPSTEPRRRAAWPAWDPPLGNQPPSSSA